MFEDDEPALVRLTGAQTIANRNEVRAAFQAVAMAPRIVVDLTGVEALDSTAIEQIFRALEASRRRGGRFAIVARSQRLIRVLSIAGITARVPIVDTIEAARRVVSAED